MTMVLRAVLIVASVLNCWWIIRRIRKSQAKIEDSVFWICFSGVLIVMSLLPELVIWGAKITGVQSPVNFVFLCIIFILMVKIFRLSVKLSIMESKLQGLAQRYGIDHLKEERPGPKQPEDYKVEKM